MSLKRKIAFRTRRRSLRVRKRITSLVPRVSVFRSNSHVYAQLIDDQLQKTVASCSTLELDKISGDKRAQAFAVGKELARRSLEKGIEKATFDRGAFLYHGRIKSLADGLREGGLQV
ncbi:MAG TPA: 50S ribosomal protein L18 [Candidatus Babeliaceae bacterium]|nr:50S ribosomal protein L18 [Candidatus Babeliaceae bacterium]